MLPKLSRPQAKVLAYWSYGMVLARSCGITLVCAALALQVGSSEQSLLQRLREWCYSAGDKKGQKRRELDVSTCFGPLLQWILAWWPADHPRLALALDATTLKKRFTVLCISVVYRGCAIPVAWKVVGAEQKGAWEPHWMKLLTTLAEGVPQHWTVIVMSDRGLYAPWLYAKIVSLGWHPFMRINKQGNFRPKGDGKFRSLATAAPTVGTAWCGVVDCFSQETSRLQCTLLSRWDEGYQEVWLIVTDLAPAQATAVWYGMRSWIEGGENRYQAWWLGLAPDQDGRSAAGRTVVVSDCSRDVVGSECGRRGRCDSAREQFGGPAPDPCGSSHRHQTCAPSHAQLFCAGDHHDCRQVDPRGWVGAGSLRARNLANQVLGSQKEEHEVQGSSGSGGRLMKKPPSERGWGG